MRRTGSPDPWPNPGPPADQEIAGGAIRAVGVDAVGGHPLGDVDEGSLQVPGRDPVEGDDRARMRFRDGTPEINGPGCGVRDGFVTDAPAERAAARIRLLLRRIRDIPSPDVEVLGRERVPPHLLPVPDVALRADGFEQADRCVLLDELLRRQVHEPMEVPPHRLVLAPMPAEELAEQPAGLLLVGPVDGIDGYLRPGEFSDKALDVLLRLGQIGWQRIDAGRRSRHFLAGERFEVVASILEPVAQAQVADDVVAVVPLDALEVGRRGPLALAQLEPLLEGDDAGPRVPEVDLPDEPVELLHLLDRVALDGGAQ